jgi:hypothetical protein
MDWKSISMIGLCVAWGLIITYKMTRKDRAAPRKTERPEPVAGDGSVYGDDDNYGDGSEYNE